MRNASKIVQPTKATARPVLTIHIDIGQLMEVVRRHVPLSPMVALAIRNDLATLFSTTQVAVVSSAPNRKTTASGDWAMNSPPSATQ
jgi:hypothetical protein